MSGRPVESMSGRSTVQLVVVIVFLSLPHLFRLPLWLDGVLVLLWAWALLAALGRLSLPGRGLLMLITLSSAAAVVMTQGGFLGREAGVALLNLMLALKLLELRHRRDGMLAVLLGFFLAITLFLFAQSILWVVYVLLGVVGLLAVLAEMQMSGEGPLPSRGLSLVGRLLLQGLPLALILFILFPRLSSPLWHLEIDGRQGISGLSGELHPGAISHLIRSGEVAFRVRFDGPVPPPEARYWRGPVLYYTDGRVWRPRPPGERGREAPARATGLQALSEPLGYTLTLEANGQPWLLVLDQPVEVAEPAYMSWDRQVLARGKVNERLRYHASSVLEYRLWALDPRQRRRALQLPAKVSGRVRALAEGWSGQGDQVVVDRALDYFSRQPFVYTLDPPLAGSDLLDEFLFETRRGFCEHYASAFTLLMRLAGIPARVVTGYQGGERNRLGEYWLVRQSDAHAWSEVWLQGRGWVRVDPTAAVAPERVERSIQPGSGAAGTAIRFRLRTGGWWGEGLRGVGEGWDALNNVWNQWVLGYGADGQRSLFESLGFERPDPWLVGAVLGGGIVLGIGLAALGPFRRVRRPVGEAERIYARFCAKLARRGLPRGVAESAGDFARRVAVERPQLRAEVARITALFVALEYSRDDLDSSGTLRGLRGLVRRFRPD